MRRRRGQTEKGLVHLQENKLRWEMAQGAKFTWISKTEHGTSEKPQAVK